MLKVKVIPQSNTPFPFSCTAHERRLTRRNVSLVILKKGKVVNIFSYQGRSLRKKKSRESSFHNVELNVKIMVSRALGATRVPTLNKLLTGTHLPGKESELHFARRQYTATAFHTPLNPRDKIQVVLNVSLCWGYRLYCVCCLIYHK